MFLFVTYIIKIKSKIYCKKEIILSNLPLRILHTLCDSYFIIYSIRTEFVVIFRFRQRYFKKPLRRQTCSANDESRIANICVYSSTPAILNIRSISSLRKSRSIHTFKSRQAASSLHVSVSTCIGSSGMFLLTSYFWEQLIA